MNLVVYTAPATEPLTLDEVKQFCRIDGTNAEPAPTAPTAALASPAAAGNVDDGAHRYLVTFVTADGETEAGVPSSAVTVADKSVNGRVALTAIPVGGAAVTSRKLYRTAAGGSTYLLLATIADNTTTSYTDNIADSALGAGAPATNTTGDPLLNLLIKAARQAAELELRRYLVTQTVDAYLDAFPCIDVRRLDQEHPYFAAREIRLPPLQSVTSITYTDGEGAEQTLDTSLYTVDAASIPARIVPAYGTTWPTTREQPNAVRVRFVAGYGAASAVPQCVKHWMLTRIKTTYDQRDQLREGGASLLPTPFVDGLLDPERVRGWL